MLHFLISVEKAFFRVLAYFRRSPIPAVLAISVVGLGLVGLIDAYHFIASLGLYAVCIAQNTAFSLTSRSRNRDNQWYHAGAAVGSNGVWLFTMKYMIDLGFEFWIFIPYVLGTVTGSLVGVQIAMWIEYLIGARADGHLSK